jgi:trigger factor
MKVKVEDLSTVKKVLHIAVPSEAVERELNIAYKDLKKKAKIKGFRPGKAPRSVLERLYKKDVNADVSSKLIKESLVDAIKETNLRIIGSPQIDPPELDAGKPFEYDATIEVNPEIEDIDFKGLKLKKAVYRITDEEIEAQLKMLQKNLAKQKPLEEERPVQDGDFVLIDYEGFKDGKPFAETAKTENFTLKVGNGHISNEFDENLIGLNSGDTKKFTVTFPEDYFNSNLANTEISFQVTINGIREEVLPEINDDMAKALGKFENLEELKKTITDNLTQGYDKRTEQELNEQIYTAMIAKTNFEVPDTMVDYELESIVAETERSLSYRNQSLEDVGLTKEKIAEKYRDTAEKQVKRHLILSKIIDQEKLTLSDEELENGYKEMAETFNQPIEEIKGFYRQHPDKVEFLKHTLLEKNAIRLIIDHSHIEESESQENAQTELTE